MKLAKPKKTPVNRGFFSLGGALVAALLLGVVPACEQEPGRPGAGEGEQAQPSAQGKTAQGQQQGGEAAQGQQQEGAEVGQIEDEPSQVIGEEVVVSGEISELKNERAFILESGGFLGIFEDEILIVTRSPIQLSGGQTLSENNDVRVRGTVERLVVTEIEQELDWDLDREIEVEFEDKPIIIADAIWLMEQKGTWTEGKQERAALDQPAGQ